MPSSTTTAVKKPVPVAVTETVYVTLPPAAGTVSGLAVFDTLIEYVGGAAITADAASMRRPPAPSRAPIFVLHSMFGDIPSLVGPDRDLE